MKNNLTNFITLSKLFADFDLIIVKGGLSGLRQDFANKSPLSGLFLT